jgi:hypothetical protein
MALRSKQVKQVHVQEMVANTALEIANELYEDFMHNNDIRAQWKKTHPGASEKGLRSSFVKKYWPACIESARATLATMLTGPLDEAAKATIHEALVLDMTLKRGRNRASHVGGVPLGFAQPMTQN